MLGLRLASILHVETPWHKSSRPDKEATMAEPSYPVPYPRRRFQRAFARLAGRALLPLLARTEIHGRERFPKTGPLLVVGNHIAAMEVVLMVVYARRQMELLGPGDLPPHGAIGVAAILGAALATSPAASH